MDDSTSPLPVLNCDNCGACCRAMGTPPGYADIISGAVVPPAGAEEFDLLWSAPAEAIELIRQNMDAAVRREPCVWFDLETLRCRFYEHRPPTCRDALQVDDFFCRRWRRLFGVD